MHSVAGPQGGPVHRIPPHVGAFEFQPLSNTDVSQKLVLIHFYGIGRIGYNGFRSEIAKRPVIVH